ncbi:MAG: LytTR family transcriptional regulator DNA-binding domain-containing protein [Flavobacteriales bacterium]|nr:LytTR family transcriptional regulator DNA-binding domain-containing protein [Flavobacteriales bacterium]
MIHLKMSMITNYKDLTYCLVLLLLATTAIAQKDEHSYRHFTEDDGLLKRTHFAMVQDSNGYLWIAGKGLTTYNGYEFKVIEPAINTPVYQLYEQADGEIWGMGDQNLFFHFNYRNTKIVDYKYNHLLEKYSKKVFINSFCIDKNGTTYFGSGHGLIVIDSSGNVKKSLSQQLDQRVIHATERGRKNGFRGFTFGSFQDQLEKIQKLMPEFDLEIIENDTKGLYLGSIREGNKVAFMTQTFIEVKGQGISWKKQLPTRPLMMGQFQKGQFWVGVLNQGLQIYSFEGELLQTYLPDKSVTDVLIDHEKGMWISTLSSGLFYINNLDIVHKINPEIKDQNVRQLAKDKNNKLYINHLRGQISQYEQGQFSSHYKSKGGYGLYIGKHSISDDLLIFDPGLGILKDNNNSAIIPYINVISDDEHNEELLAGYSNGFIKMNQKWETTIYKTGLKTRALWHAPNGIYCGTRKGLFHYSDEGDFTPMATRDTLFSKTVKDISLKKGYYYLATLGFGIVIFNKDTIYNISQKEGLNSNYIDVLQFEDDSTLWIGSNKGINKIDFSTNGAYEIFSTSIDKGLISNKIIDIELNNDSIWVATANGIYAFPLDIFDSLKAEEKQFHFVLKELLINNKKIGLNDLANLSFDQNHLSVFYEAISFKDNRLLKYRYRIEELEDQWNYTKNRNIIYPYLKPGAYTFSIQSCSNDKDWNKNEISFPIIIHPPYYQSGWFIFCITVLIALTIYFFFRIKILSYNKDITRELLRIALNRIKHKEQILIIKVDGKTLKIPTQSIYYIKSMGNYVEIHVDDRKHLFRCNIGKFIDLLPDRIEFLRVHRSYIVRVDKIKGKSNKYIFIRDSEIPIGKAYEANLLNIS